MKSEKIIGILLVVLILTIGILPFITGVHTFPDALRGFEVLRQFQDGAAFNTLNYPSVTDPMFTYHVSWWAPGQWILPYSLVILGLKDLQLVQQLLITGLLFLGTLGYYRLFKRLALSEFAIRLSIVLIVSTPLFLWQSIMYHGGDLLLTAIFPWYLLFLITRPEKARIVDVLFYIGIGIIGLYAKTSFLIIVAGGGLFLFFNGHQKFIDRFRNNWLYGLGAIAVLLFAKLILLHDETPSTAFDTEGWFGLPESLSSDLLTGFASPTGIFSSLIYPIQQLSTSGSTYIFTLLLLVLSFGTIVVLINTLLKNEKYGKLLLFIGTSSFVIFIYFYLRNNAISYEMRHYAPFAFLFFPAILNFLTNIIGNRAILLFVTPIVLINIYNFYSNYTYLHSLKVVEGIKVGESDLELVNSLVEWDKNTSNGLVLIEEYWAPAYFVKDNNKLVLKGEDLWVVSGIELDHPDRFKDKNELLKCMQLHNEVFIIGYQDNSTNLLNLADDLHLISSDTVGRYICKRVKP